MTTVIRTVPQKRMLRDVAARHAQGHEWVPSDDLISSGRLYDRARTAAALVHAGMLERAPGGSVYVYRVTPAGAEWVSRDQERDSLGRRKGYRRSAVSPDTLARARQLLAERDPGSGRKYKMQQVAEMVGLSRHTLSMQLYPERRERRLKQRRKRYNKKEQP